VVGAGHVKRITVQELRAASELLIKACACDKPKPKRKKRRNARAELVAFYEAAAQGAAGDTPHQAIPDFGALYFAPEDDEKRARESEASLNRRRSMAPGFHGYNEPEDKPELRFIAPDNIHGSPLVGLAEPVIRSPRLVSSKVRLKSKLGR